MVKYNKKYFFDSENQKPVKETKVKVKKEKKPKNTNRKNVSFYGEKINYIFKKWFLVIIIIILIVILILFVKGCSNNKSNKHKTPDEINSGEPVIIDSISVNLNQEIPKIEDFIKNYNKVKTENDSIKYDENNLVDNKYVNVGEYKVTITINGKSYNSRIIVVDKEPPVFTVKDVIINEGEYYTINDFITSCVDNSGKECAYTFENSEQTKYSNPGTYTVSIYASDLSGNKAKSQNATLTINAKEKKVTPKPATCQYGSTTNSSNPTITYSVIKNGCPIDWQYAKTDTYITIPQKMAKEDLDKLKEQMTNKNIEMNVRFDTTITPVFNDEKTGLIGYTSKIKATKVVNKELEEVIIEYSIKSDGSRNYTINKLDIK